MLHTWWDAEAWQQIKPAIPKVLKLRARVRQMG